MRKHQKMFLEYVAAHPGCIVADVARAFDAELSPVMSWWPQSCYNSILNMRRRGMLRYEKTEDGRVHRYPPSSTTP